VPNAPGSRCDAVARNRPQEIAADRFAPGAGSIFLGGNQRLIRLSNRLVKEPVRIISDLHLGHTASLAREIDQIEPLFRDVGTVIFNGDTVEMRSRENRERAVEILARVEQFCAEQQAETIFINGNHDPVISTTNHVDVAAGDILVTHGDVLFHEEDLHDRWPSRRRLQLCDRDVASLRNGELRSLEEILSTRKRSEHAGDLPHHEFTIPDGTWGQFKTFMKQTWPPRRLAHTLHGWRHTPHHAINLVRIYRPETRCIVVGHTHRPGIWTRHGYRVINTGSFLPMLGRLAVDFEDGVITVHKVVFRERKFRLGRRVARFALEDVRQAA